MFSISYHDSICCQFLVFRFLCHLFLSFLCLGRVWKTPVGLSLVLQGFCAGSQTSVKSDGGDDDDDDDNDNSDNDLDDDDCEDDLTHLYTS